MYEIGRVFRNEGISRRHNPEFTMLELYQAYGDLFSIMDLTEGVIVACVDALGAGRTLPYGDAQVNFSPPFQRAQYADLFTQYVGCDMFDEVKARAAAHAANTCRSLSDEGAPKLASSRRARSELFEGLVEEHLKAGVRLHHPAPPPLTKALDDLRIASGLSICAADGTANAYTELNDPRLQEQTFTQQFMGYRKTIRWRRWITISSALRHGMLPAGGGHIDRRDASRTRKPSGVILFPLLRPEVKHG